MIVTRLGEIVFTTDCLKRSVRVVGVVGVGGIGGNGGGSCCCGDVLIDGVEL